MDQAKPEGGPLKDAISEAAQHVEQRRVAETEGAERLKPKAQGPKIAFAVVILIGVVAWNVRGLTRAPELAPPENERVHLAWFVLDAVDIVTDFQSDEGRLPTRAEVADLLEDDVLYEPRGDAYTITMEGDAARVVYDGSIPIEEWLRLEGAVGPEGAES